MRCVAVLALSIALSACGTIPRDGLEVAGAAIRVSDNINQVYDQLSVMNFGNEQMHVLESAARLRDLRGLFPAELSRNGIRDALAALPIQGVIDLHERAVRDYEIIYFAVEPQIDALPAAEQRLLRQFNTDLILLDAAFSLDDLRGRLVSGLAVDPKVVTDLLTVTAALVKALR